MFSVTVYNADFMHVYQSKRLHLYHLCMPVNTHIQLDV